MRRVLMVGALALAVVSGVAVAGLADSGRVFDVAQKGRAFSRAEIAIAAGDTIRFTNEDPFLHQIFVHSPDLTVDSEEQRPGQDVDIRFPLPGQFHVLCSIHPKMSLEVDVR